MSQERRPIPASAMSFQLDHLLDYDDESLVAEMQRVASLVPDGRITRRRFDTFSKASSCTVVKRFGGWFEGLRRAGLEARYGGTRVSEKMRMQHAKLLTDADLIKEMQRAAGETGSLTQTALNHASSAINAASIVRRFGSWKAGLVAAGLAASRLGHRHTDEEYFENMLEVWTHYGRPPRHGEMNRPPSKITAGAYEKKWGRWSLARHAFVERMNSESTTVSSATTSGEIPVGLEAPSEASRPQLSTTAEQRHTIGLGLRYAVLRRDRFRCVVCGASRWGVDKKTVYAAIRLHQLPFIRLGKRVLLISARVIESIEQGRVPLPGGKHGSATR